MPEGRGYGLHAQLPAAVGLARLWGQEGPMTHWAMGPGASSDPLSYQAARNHRGVSLSLSSL
jgi:hypothetical protein